MINERFLIKVPYKDVQPILKRFLIRMLEKPYYDK